MISRYDFKLEYPQHDHDSYDVEAVPALKGQWVYYDDHMDALAEKERRIFELEEALHDIVRIADV